MIYQKNIVTLTWLDYASAFVLCAIIVAALIYLKNKRRDILWGVLFFIITFAPVSGIIPFGNLQIFADRYTYLPHVGLFYALGTIVLSFLENQTARESLYTKISLALLVLMILTYSTLTNQRVRVWENSETLMLDAINKYPLGSVPYCNLGKAYKDKGDYDTAIKYYKIAISHDPEDPVPYNNLGHIYLKRGEKDLAKSHFEKAIDLAPNYANSVYNLAIIAKDEGQVDEALKLYKRAIALDPFLYQAHNNLGNIYLRRGLVNEAIAAYKEAVKINPKFFLSQINLARTYHQADMLQDAMREYNKCLRLDPNNEEVKRNITEIINSTVEKR